MKTLETAITITNTATTVEITEVINSVENSSLTICYLIRLEDGTPYKRGRVLVDGKIDILAMYAEIDSETALGLKFQVASSKVLYARVLNAIASGV